MTPHAAVFLAITLLCWLVGYSVGRAAEGAGVGVVIGAVLLWNFGGK